jgi:very-short-patch-repair endonuclease
MATTTLHSIDDRAIWRLVRRQRGVIARWQLLNHGLTPMGIKHRVRRGRLIRIHRGVYAVGTKQLHPDSFLIAAVLVAGPGAALSHASAAAAWGILDRSPVLHQVSVPATARRHVAGLTLHRRTDLATHTTTRRGIPITKPVLTLIDLAATLRDDDDVDEAIDAADRLNLIDPERLLRALDRHPGRPGTARLRRLLTHHTRVDSRLERRFLTLIRSAGLPKPQSQRARNGHRTDFLWPEQGVVVEVDSLTYHRTAAKQAKDIHRDNDHVMNGLAVLRFSHAQIRDEPDYVMETLTATLASAAAQPPRAPLSAAA